MPELSQNALLYGAGGLFALAVLLLVIALRLFRRSRRDVFWRRRREAGQRGWRVMLLALVLFGLSGITCAATLVIGAIREDGGPGTPSLTAQVEGQSALASPTLALDAVTAITASVPDTVTPTLSTPEPNPTALIVVLPTNLPLPAETVVVIVTATPGSTPTLTPFPTFTPNARPLVAEVTPRPDASLEITALDDEVSATLSPVDPATSFPPGTERIYLFVSFANMAQGVLWRRELYRDDVLIEGSSYLWGLPTEGQTSFFFGSDSGFAPGRYEVRLYLGDAAALASRATLIITAPDTS